MTIARHYVMVSTDTAVADLRGALQALAEKVQVIAGCEGVALFQDTSTPTRFTFIEYWSSVAAHKAGGAVLGKEAFAPVLAVLAGPPEGTYIEQIAI